MLLNIAQSHLRAQSFRIFVNFGENGGRLSSLEREITCDATDMPPSRGESAVLRR